MQELMKPFNFQGHLVRTITLFDETPYFVGSDIAEILGYEQPHGAIGKHCRQIFKGSMLDIAKNFHGGDYKTLRAQGYTHNDLVRRQLFIPESDVFRLVMKSRLPEAELFRDWLCDEVLPQTRKSGTDVKLHDKSKTPSKLTLDSVKSIRDFYGFVLSVIPDMEEGNRQELLWTLSRDVAGIDCLPHPKEQKGQNRRVGYETLWTATELGEEFGVGRQMVGWVANRHGLKTHAYGKSRTVKSCYSDCLVEQFCYNERGRGRERLAELINSKRVD